MLEKCILCPRECKANRLKGDIGFCRTSEKIKIALYSVHQYEEPCISGINGSGTVFFTGCNLRCKFCQNYVVSQENKGYEISIEKLSDIFIELQNKKVNNINLVTGFAYVPLIIQAIEIAREKGLNIPIIYNSSGYESVETIKMLKGYIDIYLPDFKYYYNELGVSLSGVSNYYEVATQALIEMKKQVGENEFDNKGILKKGIIVRHLILPNHIQNSKRCLKWVRDNLGKKTYVSIMAQYFPTYKAKDLEDVNRKITEEELKSIREYSEKLGFENGFIQDLEEQEEQYVPNF